MLLVGIVAALVLLVVAVGVMVAGDDDGGDDVAIATRPPEPADPTLPGESPSLPSLPLDPSVPGSDPEALARPLEDVLPEIIAFVEETRGHEFLTEPVVEAVDDAEFEDRLAQASAADEASLQVDQTALRALGIVDPDTDLVGATRTAGAAGVLGFYQPASGELLVKGDVVTPLVQTVIAHELTHALDDQHFDLSRIEALAEQPDESAFGLVAVVEGTARWVEYQFRDQMSPEELAAISMEELELGMDQMQLLDLPLPLLVQSQVPYSVGHRFVSAIVDEGGLDLLDVAVERPPTTSEQVLDPTLFASREPATAVPAPEPRPGGTVVDRGAFGAIDLRMMEVVADPMSAAGALTGELEPVDGFGGGAFVSWTSSQGDDCITVHLRADSAEGVETVGLLVQTWSEATGGGWGIDGAGPGIDAISRCV